MPTPKCIIKQLNALKTVIKRMRNTNALFQIVSVT